MMMYSYLPIIGVCDLYVRCYCKAMHLMTDWIMWTMNPMLVLALHTNLIVEQSNSLLLSCLDNSLAADLVRKS